MASPKHGWFIRDWLKTAGLKQADLSRALGWSKAKASDLVTGKQPYSQEILEESALVLNVQPWELLLHPHDAMALRRLRQVAAEIVAESPSDLPSSDPIRKAS